MAQEAVVVFDYTKEQDDELTLNVGDVIKNVVEVDEGWCEGVLNGDKGMFPTNFVKLRAVPEITTPFVPPTGAPLNIRDSEPSILRGTTAKKKGRRAKVTFSYAADNEDELTLTPGKVVEILAEEEEGWWRGHLDGHEGVFPSNFVEEILEAEEVKPPSPEPQPEPEPPAPAPVPAPVPVTAAPKQPLGTKMFPGGGSFNPIAARANLKKSTSALPPAEPKKPPEMIKKPSVPVTTPTKPQELPDKRVPEKKGEMYKVTFGYIADVEDELTIVVGDIVEIMNKEVGQDGWWEVRLGDKKGLIPNNFVELMVSAPPPKQAQPKPPPPVVHQKEPPAIPGKPKKPAEIKKPPPAIPAKAEPPPPALDTTDNPGDFGVPTTTPLDSSAVKSRPKKISRPPSRSNLLMEEPNNIEPKPEPARAPEKPPEKPEPASNIAPWQRELKTRKVHKPPAPKPMKKTMAPKPTAPTPTSHKPEIDKPKPPAAVTKPHVETKQPPPPHKETPVIPPSTSANAPAPSIPRTQSQSRSITPTLPPSESTPPSDGAWKAEINKLREEFESFKKNVLQEIEVLTDDLDKERKFRAALEVDIDRLKKAARPTAAFR